jgi:hypothetical protein
MKRLSVLSVLAGTALGCASAPPVDVTEPSAPAHQLCATWVAASFDPSEPNPCVPHDRFTPEQLGAVEKATSSVIDTMNIAAPVCPSDPAEAARWQELVAEWIKAKGDRVLSTQRELEQLAGFDVGFVIGAGSLAALYEHYALQALAAPRPNTVEGDGVPVYRAAMTQLFGPWTEKAREAYQSCAKRAVEANVASWADFCRSRQEKLEARINLARSRERCPDQDPSYVVGIINPDAAAVQRDIEAANRSLYSGDVDGVLRYTHPTILQMLGGPEKARQTLAKIVEDLEAQQMKVESFSFPEPPQFFEGGGRRFVYVPTLMVINAKDVRVESLNFQLGVLEPAASDWKYVEGSRMTPENVQQLFPGFPKDKPFPKFYRKKL